MKYSITELELETVLESMKLINLENQTFMNNDEAEISEVVLVEILKTIRERILFLLRSDESPNSESVFKNITQSNLKHDRFKKEAASILDEYNYLNKIMDEKILVETIPDSILLIMQELATSGNEINDLVGSNFDTQYFLSQYLMYRTNEQKLIYDSNKINKNELYNMVYGEENRNTKILEKIVKVKSKHKKMFKNTTNNVEPDAAKKKFKQVILSERKSDSMNQSDELNVFQQHALLNMFLIDTTKYQRFLNNPSTQRVPDPSDFEEMKQIIEEFMLLHPISGIDDKLFLKTVSEDTYHFALFNAITQLTTAIFKSMNDIINISSKSDSLSMLFIIGQMINNTPVYTAEWVNKYREIVDGIDKISKYPEIKEVVHNAVKDEEALDYAKKTMLEMFEKYTGFQKNPIIYDFVDSDFKRIVKEFYTFAREDNSYNR